MDRDTLQDDLDLVLERSRGDELPGEWDWEPPLGTSAPVASSAAEPTETEVTRAGDPVEGPGDETEDDADDADDEEEQDD